MALELDPPINEDVSQVVALNLISDNDETGYTEVIDVPHLDVDFDGVAFGEENKDRHYGRTRIIRDYQAGQWSGRIVRNERQLSIATTDDLVTIAKELEIVNRIHKLNTSVIGFMSKALSVNMVIDSEQLEDFMGSGTKLYIGESEPGAIVSVFEAHYPCSDPAGVLSRELELDYDYIKSAFKSVARHRRGFMSEIFSPGKIKLGDPIAVQLPIDHRRVEE